jgi:hypothetical protein
MTTADNQTTHPTDDTAQTDTGVDEQHDAADAAQADDDQDNTDNGNPNNHEAARYRVERNDARRQRDRMQQERDQAREQLTRMRQSVVNQIASAAGLSDSGLLAYEGHDLDSLLTDFGTVDTDKVRTVTAEVMRKYGIIRRMGLSPNPQQGSGSGAPPRGSTSEQWARSFGPSR